MTRYCKLMLCMLIVLSATALASAQSLGDIARSERNKQKPQAARTYTNDDIPSVTIPKDEPKTPAAGTEANATDDKKDGEESAGATETKDEAKIDKKGEEATSVEKQNQLNAEWKAKVAAQKAKVADIEREIDLMQREERLRVAVYYADAGNRLRDDKKWADDEKKYQDDLATRQKDLSEAKAKLSDARDAARKAGATSVE
jgi:hypothetical protein